MSSRKPPTTPLTNGNVTHQVFNTHLLPNQLPQNSKCIYVVRDGLDVLASFFYHLVNMRKADGGYEGTESDFCKDFVNGNIAYGKWQDHIERWLGSSSGRWEQEGSAKLLILHYQDMKTDLAKEATRVARFMGVEDAQLKRVVKEAIIHCTFDAMRTERWRYTPRSVEWKTNEATGKPYEDFVRSGQVGDGNAFWEEFADSQVKEQWNKDSQVAQKRWLYAGINESIAIRYLGPFR